jgi:hypothetical protein
MLHQTMLFALGVQMMSIVTTTTPTLLSSEDSFLNVHLESIVQMEILIVTEKILIKTNTAQMDTTEPLQPFPLMISG